MLQPHFYQTNWFLALCAAMFLAMLWAAYQFRVRQLHRVSKQLRDVVDTIPGYVWSALPDGSLDFINRRWLEFSGLSSEEGLGRGWEAAVHPDDLARFVDEWRAAVASGKAMESEARVRRADGQYRWLLIRNVPLHDKRGKIVKWYGTSTDIDDRKRAEETLREQADLLNLTHDAIFVMTMEGVIKYWNRGAEEQYGWTAEQAVGRSVHDLLKTVFPAPPEQIKAEVVRTGRWEGEVVHTKKDETRVVVASRWSLQRGEQGAPIAILETNNDITDRKRAEEAFGRLNRELRAISNCNQILLRASDEQSLPEEICRIVCEEAGYRVAWVAYAEHDEAKSVRPAAWTGTEEGYLANLGITWADTQHGWGPTGTAIRSGKSCCIQDFATDTRMATWRESAVLRDFRSGIALPLKDECGDAFGSLTIYSEQPNAFNSEEIRLLEELASDLAFGIVTLRSRAARQRAEETLREGETRFRTFVDHAADALFIYDFEQGTIVDVNRQACESLGYTRQELIGTTAVAFHLESDRAQMESLAERAAAGETVIDTHWHRRKDGTLFPVEVHTSQYWYGGRRFLLKVARDITDRKRAEEALRRSEAYLAEGQRLSHTGSFAWSAASLQSIYWSEEMFRIFGLNPQEGVPSAEAFWQRIHPEDLDRTRELLLKAAGGNMHYEHDHRILLPDGTVKHIHAIGHPVLGENGQVADYVGTAVDVTDRKRAEEERERLRQLEADLAHINRVGMMGELAASIAHEVNQPLSGVVVNANACLRWLAGDSPNLDEAREAVRRIVRDGKRAGDVIARIRALATKTATAKERLYLNEAVREVVAFAGDQLRKNRVAVRTELADDLLPVSGDRVQLQQVVLNLVMNGIEAMSSVEERPRELIIRTQNDDAGQVRVTVQDSGKGLDPQSMERMFEAFYTTKHGGMGMGLAISRSIIQNHGGKLWAVANDGPGISVQFTIPKYQQ